MLVYKVKGHMNYPQLTNWLMKYSTYPLLFFPLFSALTIVIAKSGTQEQKSLIFKSTVYEVMLYLPSIFTKQVLSTGRLHIIKAI